MQTHQWAWQNRYMSCSCSFHNFSLIFCGSRLEIGHVCRPFGFLATQYLWFTTLLTRGYHMSREWLDFEGRGFWKDSERERKTKSGIHTLDLWFHLHVKLAKPDLLMSNTTPDVWIFGWGRGWGLNNLHPCQNVKKLFNIFYKNNFNFF
jgi:hypothetical protein